MNTTWTLSNTAFTARPLECDDYRDTAAFLLEALHISRREAKNPAEVRRNRDRRQEVPRRDLQHSQGGCAGAAHRPDRLRLRYRDLQPPPLHPPRRSLRDRSGAVLPQAGSALRHDLLRPRARAGLDRAGGVADQRPGRDARGPGRSGPERIRVGASDTGRADGTARSTCATTSQPRRCHRPLRELTGLDAQIAQRVLVRPGAHPLLGDVLTLTASLLRWRAPDRQVVQFGRAGGRHRSVAAAEHSPADSGSPAGGPTPVIWTSTNPWLRTDYRQRFRIARDALVPVERSIVGSPAPSGHAPGHRPPRGGRPPPWLAHSPSPATTAVPAHRQRCSTLPSPAPLARRTSP